MPDDELFDTYAGELQYTPDAVTIPTKLGGGSTFVAW